MIELTTRSFSGRTSKALRRLADGRLYSRLDQLGREGVRALREATPVDSGLTASSWSYQINKKRGSVSISWHNTHMAGSSQTPVAILIQYGHANRAGGWIEGTDYINPALKPVFEKIANQVWEEVKRA